MAFVGAVLDDPFYGGALDYMRKELTSKRHLDLFRRLYLAHEGARARATLYEGRRHKTGEPFQGELSLEGDKVLLPVIVVRSFLKV